MSQIYTVLPLETHSQVCRWEDTKTATEYAASDRRAFVAGPDHPAVKLALPLMQYVRDERNVAWLPA